MGWKCIEGIDRSGKSSIAAMYKLQGYKIVHMSAPDKKYFDKSYSGESYLEELVGLYSKYDGQNVVFDRTPMGELIWPNVYGREAMLSEEDIDYLASIENNNDAERILMYDSNSEAHWQRCVANNEPLTRQQFGRANIFYERLAKDYGFKKKQLSDFPGYESIKSGSDTGASSKSVQPITGNISANGGDTSNNGTTNESSKVGGRTLPLRPDKELHDTVGSIEDKLERANAIKVLLQGQILKKKGGAYDDLEQVIREFLQRELDKLFTPEGRNTSFSDEEINILKLYVARIKEKMG